MKKILFITLIPGFIIFGFSGCYKTCTDPLAPNYTLKGDCIDLTLSITGNYTGTFMDSVAGVRNTISTGTLQITKIDDSHVQVAAPGTAFFISYSAVVSASANGYYLTVASQYTDGANVAQISNGVTVVGAGTYFGNPADGVYVTGNKQLSVYASLNGNQYEGFTGTQQ